MSKKECKRVPSYAIRHLIQSLKEKGRTCRKGAEQRIDREILICDPEEEYVRRLAEALLLKKGDSRSANLFVAGNGTGVTEDWSDKGIVDQ